MLKAIMAFTISATISCALVTHSQAEYFSNMRGGQTVEAEQASAKAFAAMAQLMTGLSTLELAKGDDAKAHLSTAVNTMREAAGEFQALSETNANISLEVKFGDALTELAQTLEVSPEKIATVGDVLALTSQSLTTAADVLDKFITEPTADNYTALRKSVENTLRAGDLSSKLLQ
jgi:hypothetical protein